MDAVNYGYGPSGMWRDQTGVQYQWNYYDRCANGAHPYDKTALIVEGGAVNVTAPDADCVILGDLDDDGEVFDDQPTGLAFFEHAGRVIAGTAASAPFYQFWFDDNWLARYMAAAYSRQLPGGLHDHGATVRWRLLGGDNSHWRPYAPDDHVNTLALNGLYEINAGSVRRALVYWISIRNMSGATYNSATQRYEYPAIRETYELGLWAILSERLLATPASFPERNEVLQHAMAIRSNLLSLQEKSASGERLAWRTAVSDPLSLMNTETLAVSVLALGANADWVLEPGYAPLAAAPGDYFLRSDNVMSAVVGVSPPGEMLAGPDWSLPPGTYDVDFSMRAPTVSPAVRVATLSVSDGTGILASIPVAGSDLPGEQQWLRRRLTVVVATPGNRMRFLVNWPGAVNIDLGPVRISRRSSGEPGSANVPATPVTLPNQGPVSATTLPAKSPPATTTGSPSAAQPSPSRSASPVTAPSTPIYCKKCMARPGRATSVWNGFVRWLRMFRNP